MALRLRRGTDAERQLITPVQGELIYTTDTKLLYVGDGSTAGGTLVSGVQNLSNLLDVDVTGATDGQVLAYDTDLEKWVATDNVAGASVSSIFDLDDVFTDGSLAVGNILRWDGLNFTPAPINEIFQEQQNYKINIVGDDSTILVDTDTNTFTGVFVGDVVGNVVGNVAGDVTGSVFGDNSTLLVDAVNSLIPAEVVQGTFSGNVTGDVVGSVFADDSTLLVDAINNRVTTDILTTNVIKSVGPLSVRQETDGQISQIEVESVSEQGILKLTRKASTDISSDDVIYGGLYFQRNDTGGEVATALMLGYSDKLVWAVDEDGSFSQAQHMVFDSQGRLGVGNWAPTEKLVVDGNAVMTGFVQFGSLTTVERDALTAANGMVIYNTTDNKFQGYENGAWINLI